MRVAKRKIIITLLTRIGLGVGKFIDPIVLGLTFTLTFTTLITPRTLTAVNSFMPFWEWLRVHVGLYLMNSILIRFWLFERRLWFIQN